jgi:hypothetical protein
MISQQQKRLALLNFLIKMPPKPNSPEAQLVELWKKELAQLQKELV